MASTALYVVPLIPVGAALGVVLTLILVPVIAVAALLAVLLAAVALLPLSLTALVKATAFFAHAFRSRASAGAGRAGQSGDVQSEVSRPGRGRGLSGSSDQGSSSWMPVSE